MLFCPILRDPVALPLVAFSGKDAQTLEIAAVACTDPPPGYARWSLRLLTRRVVELAIVDAIAPETIRQALKKTGSSHGAPCFS